MPSQEAIARVDAYMQQGGTVLFDTRDQYAQGFGANDASPATQRLRDILADLNVPPLEPVPEDHVLTKSFFILAEFPGRFNGSPLWVEASLDASNSENRPGADRRRRLPDHDHRQRLRRRLGGRRQRRSAAADAPLYSMQRVYALRSGVNIVMYMLTGNYKSDQVHVPILLERRQRDELVPRLRAAALVDLDRHRAGADGRRRDRRPCASPARRLVPLCRGAGARRRRSTPSCSTRSASR